MKSYLDPSFSELTREASPEKMALLAKHWKRFFATGVVTLVLGALAIVLPVPSTIVLTFTLAFLLLISGGVQFVQAVKLRHEHGSVVRFAQSVLSVVAGGLMLRYPEGGILSVALILSFYFFLNAAAQMATALTMRPQKGWGWQAASAVATLFLGLFLIAAFPFSALWMPGFLLGIDLLMMGSSLIAVAWALRETREPAAASRPLRSAHQG